MKIAWTELAACREADTSLFFAEGSASTRPDDYRQARELCAACPVTEACLNDALRHETSSSRVGLFGGMDPEEREYEAWRRRREARRVSA